jgi:tetratricopeptide (TPR) repeat protein
MNDWFEAEQRVERAQQLAESRRWSEALAELDAALAINPSNGAWLAHRGYVLDQLELFEDAIRAYRASAELEPGDVDVLMALGVDLARTGRGAEAIDALTDAARIDPDLEPAYCYRILAYAEMSDHDRAEEMFYLAQQLREDCPHCFFHMGTSLAARGLYDRAIFCWGRTLDIDPTYPGVKHAIAEAHREQGNLDRAREYYLAEIRQDPGNIDLLFDLAELEHEAGFPERGVAKLRQIIELEPEYGQAHFSLGEMLLELEQPDEALIALRSASDLDPDLPRLQFRLGEACMGVSDFGQADRYLAAAAVSEPADESVLLLWGNCLLRLRRVGDAANMFRRVLALEEECPEAHHNLGVCYFLKNEYDAGLEHMLRAVELNPEDPVAMHKAVLVLMHVRRWTEARSMIDRALELDSNDAALRELKAHFWRYRLRSMVRRATTALRTLATRVRK